MSSRGGFVVFQVGIQPCVLFSSLLASLSRHSIAAPSPFEARVTPSFLALHAMHVLCVRSCSDKALVGGKHTPPLRADTTGPNTRWCITLRVGVGVECAPAGAAGRDKQQI